MAKLISIVATMFQSSDTIEEFSNRCFKTAEKLPGYETELILVDDGSPDESLKIAKTLQKTESRISIVELSKNFGHHKAMMAGMSYSTGDLVFLIDSDLEESPENLIEFLNLLLAEDLDVVFGRQGVRRGHIFNRWVGKLYYSLFRVLSGVKQPDNIVTCRLMVRKYVDALLMHNERELSIGGLWIETGFNQKPVEIIKTNSSPTTYNFSKRIITALDAVTSFSNIPLYLNFICSLLILLISIGLVSFYFVSFILNENSISGFTSLAILLLLTLGITSLLNGINSVYLAKIFSEVKQRPLYIVKNFHNGKLKRKVDEKVR